MLTFKQDPENKSERGVEVSLVGRVSEDDPAFNPEREMFVVRYANGMDVYAPREHLDGLDEALPMLEEREKAVEETRRANEEGERKAEEKRASMRSGRR